MFDENSVEKKWVKSSAYSSNAEKNLFARFHTLKDRGQVKALSWSEINRPVIVFCILIILRLFGRKKHTILLQLLESEEFEGDLQNHWKEIYNWLGSSRFDGWPNQLFCQSNVFGHQNVCTRQIKKQFWPECWFILFFVEKSIYKRQNTNEPWKKPSYLPLYWLVNREPYIGLLSL